MLKLVLPQNILVKEQYAALSSIQKGEYMTNLLKQILELNPNGITISQVDKALKLGHSTIWHHLENLAARAECLKMERGDTAVYDYNKVIHTLDDCDIQGKFYFYDLDIVENSLGRFVRIQIKQENASGNMIAHSGVIVRLAFFDEFLNSLHKIKELHMNLEKDKEFFGEIAKPNPEESHPNEDKK